MRHWSNPWIGLEWGNGLDCWKLVAKVYANLGIEVPVYDYSGPSERAEIAAIVADAIEYQPWLPVMRGNEREFDVLVFRVMSFASHVGIVVEKGRMLHVYEGGQSCVARYDDGRWKSRFLGAYRHEALAHCRCDAA